MAHLTPQANLVLNELLVKRHRDCHERVCEER